ncbi:hypothetical protein M9H77_14218 [Catharanthus roseus]|uniref:Uncharacterized protein n=1 Tax=Catharanthus roseus TaxID=4058 RepID=A0ACC0BMP8_CATRO|nr:hypothetical protein M9H77_14218 [Catharanthus roseus]
MARCWRRPHLPLMVALLLLRPLLKSRIQWCGPPFLRRLAGVTVVRLHYCYRIPLTGTSSRLAIARHCWWTTPMQPAAGSISTAVVFCGQVPALFGVFQPKKKMVQEEDLMKKTFSNRLSH